MEDRIRRIATRFGLDEACLQALLEALAEGSTLVDQTIDEPLQEEDVDDDATQDNQLPIGIAEVTIPVAPPQRIHGPDVSTRYQDLGVLGSGGMGVVRRVFDRDLNRMLAMKILRPELMKRPRVVKRFLDEAQATAQLEHPSIVPIYDVGLFPDKRPYFTMMELQGRTLLDVIHEVHEASPTAWADGPTGWNFHRLMTSFQKVCEAIAYAHNRGVIHRDIKPENILVGDFGEVLVVDWGLAKVLSQGQESDAVIEELTNLGIRAAPGESRAGRIVGTPAYMPPEQARGDSKALSPTCDVYALGAILYEILSGRSPYEGSSWNAVLQKVLSGPPPPLRGGTDDEDTFMF
ncbi:MAG: serine/threonine-protein kinase, partial [Myxococcota bacterium]|nr:serine/threonine-protein kinase [Myxococcota bacterium]